MSKFTKIFIISILILAVAVIIILKEKKTVNAESKKIDNPVAAIQDNNSTESKVLPRLVDLGADKCIPCKMMAPILEELKKEYAGIFNVEFIDVWQKQDEGRKYGIRVIPTQIFFDASGEELFRHEGFFSREDILTTWQELNIDIDKVPE